MKIGWVGSTDCFEQPLIQPASPGVWCAMTEEAVWRTVQHNAETAQRGILSHQALMCTSRLALRVALATTDLNPKWHPLYLPPGWIKRTSVENNGVANVVERSVVDRHLELQCPEMANMGVWEQDVGGDAIEVDGFVKEGNHDFVVFHQLEQIWNGDKIIQYIPEEYYPAGRIGLDDFVRKVIDRLQLSWTPFCFEFRRQRNPTRYYLIDAHCRFPEDKKLRDIMPDPIGKVEKCIASST